MVAINYDLEFKQEMRKNAIQSIVEVYNYDYDTALKLVQESKSLEYSLTMTPDMVMHCSAGQLADLVIDYIEQI